MTGTDGGDTPQRPAPSSAPGESPEPGGEVQRVRRRRSLVKEPKPSLTSPLLSGRSLQAPPASKSWFRRNLRLLAVGAAVLVLVGAAVGIKAFAEVRADAVMGERRDALATLLDGAEPADLMAFDAGVRTRGSVAQRVRDTPGFRNVRATADLAFIRFQPTGWWAGFTERCLVVLIRADGVSFEQPKTSCVRVQPPPG